MTEGGGRAAGVQAASAVKLLNYVDPEDGFRGYLALAGDAHRLAAGGLRVQPGVRGETLVALAETMRLKERLLGLAVDGAKAGIELDPRSAGKPAALRRFLRFLRPHLAARLSLGPDVGTTWTEVEAAARAVGLVSVKLAVARAQGLSEPELLRRLRLLDFRVDGLTLGQRRAGHALAHAALAAADVLVGPRQLRVAVQGFGTLGRGTVLSLALAGARVVSIADEHGCVVGDGLDVARLLSIPHGAPVSAVGRHAGRTAPRDAVAQVDADLVVLAACEDGLSEDQAAQIRTLAVAVGANLGLSAPAERLLHARGIVVVPDFVGGCGGSASMDALFGPAACPDARTLLDHVAVRMGDLVRSIIDRSSSAGVTPRQAALALCQEVPDLAGARPYGHWHPASQRLAPSGSRRG